MTERFETVDDFLRAVRERYETLPKQLQTIAKHVELNRDRMIVTRITDIARACGVQPSAVTRFSQRFGMSGFSELQVLFRNAFSASAIPSINCARRVRSLVQSGGIGMDAGGVLRRVLLANQGANEDFAGRVDDRSLRAAVELLHDADQIYVVGVRRSHAAACYLAYLLQHISKPIHLVDGFGGTFAGQMRSISRGDLLVAVSLTPYARETRNCVRIGASRGAKILAITDTGMGPEARAANVQLIVNEASVVFFRSLTNTLCLCQALFIAAATRFQFDVDSRWYTEMKEAEADADPASARP